MISAATDVQMVLKEKARENGNLVLSAGTDVQLVPRAGKLESCAKRRKPTEAQILCTSQHFDSV